MKKKSIMLRVATLLLGLSSGTLSAQFVSFVPSPSSCGLDCYVIYTSSEWLQPPLTYQWNTGENSDNITICQPGCYSVTITDGNGVSSDSTLCLDLVFDPNPTIQATPDCPASQEPILVDSNYVVCQQACIGSTIRYSSSISGLDSLSSNWSVFNENTGQPADYTTIEDNIIEVTWSQPGIYSIYQSGIVNEPPFFCDAQGYTCVNVVSPPESAVSSVPEAVEGTVTLCQGQPLYLEYTGEEADSLYWDFGNGVTATGEQVDYTYPEAGTYELMLIASRFCACNDTTLLTVAVEQTETPIVDCVGTVCEGMLGTYTAQSDCSTFLWSVSEGGVIVDGGGPADDFISVLWETGPEGTVELLTEDCPGTNCPVPATLVVPVISDQAEVEGPALVCPGSRAVYSIPAYEGVSFEWDVTNFGSIVSGQGTHEIEVEWLNTIPAPTQTVSVTFDNCYLGCGGSAELEVEIQPAFYLSGPIEVCPNTPATYDAIQANTGNPIPAIWRLTDASDVVVWQSSGSTASVEIPMNVAPGFYLLTAEPGSANSSCTPKATRRVQVLSPPDPVDAIAGNTVICPGSTTTYSATPVGDNVTLEWTVNNGETLTTRMGETINVTWGTAPPYELSVVQVNTVGPPCASSPVSLAAEAFDDLEVSGDPNACFDGISTFTATDAEHLDYEWTIIPATAGTIVSESDESTVDILWHEVGNVQVQAAICTETAVFEVEVHALPQPTVTAPAFFCPNEEATVSAAPGFDSYTWYNTNDVAVATGMTPELAPGSYALVVTDEFGCEGTETFQIEPYPSSEVSISTPDPWIFCNLPPSTRLVAQASSTGFSYQWFQDGAPVGTDAPEYTATEFGIYTVGITDQNGCTFLSAPFEVEENCNDVICGNPPGPSCSGVDMGFEITDGTECETKLYTNQSGDMLPGTAYWRFFFRDGVLTDASNDENPTIEHQEVGYYRVVLSGSFPNPDDPGTTLTCRFSAVDSVEALADFHVAPACANSPTAFEDLSTFLPSSGIVDWSWNFGDPGSGADNTSTQVNPTHVFSATGDYLVTLTITTISGCTSSTTKTVSVVAPPPVVFDSPETNCASSPTAFEVPAGGFALYEWDFGDPGSGAANTSQRREAYHRYELPGTYEVTLSATNIEGCIQSFSQNVLIAPNNLSGEITLDPIPPVCQGVDINAESPGGGIGWQWSTGADTESLTLTEEGIYELTVTDANGCTYEPPAANVGITPAPLVDIRATDYDEYGQATAYYYESYSTCQGEGVFLEVPNSELYPGYTYTWSTGQNGPAIEFSEDKNNLLDAGNYTFEVTAVDGATGCSAVAMLEVIVHPLPDVPVILADQPAPICEGTMATLSVDAPLPGLTYVWSTGETGTAIEVSEGGEYTVTATNAEGCTQVSEAFELLTGPDIARVPNGCYTRCRPDTICLPDIPNVASYQWYFNGSPVAPPEGTMPELIVEDAGDYYLEMVATNGCVLQSDPLSLELFDGFGSFAGEVYFDVNDNGIIDAPDTLLSGIDILLLQNGSILDQSTSTQDGGYGFTDQPSNEDYTLAVDTANLEGFLEAVWVNADTTLVGCDQVVVTDWLIRINCPTESDTTLTFSACEGSSITYDGVEIAAGSQDVFHFTNTDGCDSTVNVLVEELEVFTNAFDLSFCEGEILEHDGMALNEGLNEITLSSSAGCDSVLQIQVALLEPVTTEQSVRICEGETYFFHGEELLPGESGTVMLISEAGCDSIVNLSVELSPDVMAGISTEAACPNEETGTLSVNPVSAPNPPYTYAIGQGSPQASPDFEGLAAGNYTVTITDGSGCETTFNGLVEAFEPLAVMVRWDTLSCENPESIVTVDITSGETPDLAFTWSDGAAALDRVIGTAGTYDLEIDNGCETFSESIMLAPPLMEGQNWMYVPNAFSPNGDNNNDVFRAFTSDEVAGVLDYRLRIFDRWGVQVFESTDPDSGWDGVMNGTLRNGGVFAWSIQAKVINCLQEEVAVDRRGEVVLLR
ncbi:PKD domain-containing protein [Phaeodactylibacter sp.]|uniref:PKD domain-containing protein n=1 Tax=Phaeodactylibacter sp. TaxID=1940289 RepID=UPI0025FB447D|nr:PKD domain-containing protein [Phaeodactylibacter sp.]MCI4650793.1 PKD domain-containing protein [Phaeodactylibacter sp.]MCI5089750.1 PKD domain-containing protein [Phaeodactylibacter sp.]